MKVSKYTESEIKVKYFNQIEISYILGITEKQTKIRIDKLKMLPDAIIGKSKCYTIEKLNNIMTLKAFEKKEVFLIFESKMND